MPANTLAYTVDMKREDWLKNRRKGLGGSDIGALFGMNKYTSKFALWLDKIGEAPPDEGETDAQKAGHKLEPVVAEWFAEKFQQDTGIEIVVRERHELLQHPNHEFLLANIDREIVYPDGSLALLECKTADKFFMDEWQNDKIPDSYFMQVQHYLNVEDRYEHAYIAVLVGGNTFVYHRIERDPELHEAINQVASDFWNNHVLTELPPTVSNDPSESTDQALRHFYSFGEGEVDLESEYDEKIERLQEVKQQLKDLESEKKALENELKGLIGSKEVALINGVPRITWKNSKPSLHFDKNKFEQEHPELYKKYCEEKAGSRRFLIKKKKENKKVDAGA